MQSSSFTLSGYFGFAKSVGKKINGGINSQALKVDEDMFQSWLGLACQI